MNGESGGDQLHGRREQVGPETLAQAVRLHDKLWLAVVTRPLDFEPYGLRVREGANDCSCGCKHFAKLQGGAGLDWGVCVNPHSHRCGLLTFEHMGCPHFEPGAES
jgi:hypothetical protein